MQAPVNAISKIEGGFAVQTGLKSWTATRLLITTGGKSYPGCGTTGDGYRWAESFGHTIVETVPALTPIVTTEQWVKDLKGITVTDCRVGVFESKNVERLSDKNFEKLALANRRSSLLFTHFGLSGPSALDVSKQIAYRSSELPSVVIDFLPDISFDDLFTKLAAAELQRKQLGTAFSSLLPNRLSDRLIERLELDPKQKLAEVSQKSVISLLRHVKRCLIQVEGTRGYKKAEVTAGGVNLKEVNSRTMESKLCEGLFFAGEILDLDGPIGGYNFQSAFSTGYVAGSNA